MGADMGKFLTLRWGAVVAGVALVLAVAATNLKAEEIPTEPA